MNVCDLTLPTPEENLACDEALLDSCEAGAGAGWLRFWEPTQYFIVVGYANRVAAEVNIEFCGQNGIRILRRCSGGGTVLQGPGCLNYSLVLRISDSSPLGSISRTNDFILERHRLALARLVAGPIEKQGHTDLAIDSLKFSGNAQRRRQHSVLFHGCFLLNLDFNLVEKALPLPSKQPDYRANRSHTQFLLNLQISPSKLKAALASVWKATDPCREVPFDQITALARRKYSRPEWNSKF